MIDEENQPENTPPPSIDSLVSEAVVVDGSDSEALPVEAVVLPTEGAPEAVISDLPGADFQIALAEKDSEIKAIKAQLDDRTNQLVRTAADFDNFRKRTAREREEQEQQVKCSTINELLPVIDNFERARSQLKPQTEAESTVHKSYQSVYKQLVECLKRIGVSPMRAQGSEFDPNLHEAVLRQATDEFPEGTVIEELQRGYLLGDRVLRHALVKVAAAPEPVIPSEETDQNVPEG